MKSFTCQAAIIASRTNSVAKNASQFHHLGPTFIKINCHLFAIILVLLAIFFLFSNGGSREYLLSSTGLEQQASNASISSVVVEKG